MQPNKITLKTQQFPAISVTIIGDGPETLLLLHGFPATHTLWREVAPALSKKFKVIIPDLPGVGASVLGTKEVSIAQLGQAMIEILDQLGLNKVIIAGHSMGGYIALAMANISLKRIIGLSLVHSTAMPDDEEKKSTRKKAIALIGKGGKPAFIQASVPSLFSDSFKTTHGDVVDRQVAEGLGVEDETLIAFYNAMMQRPSSLDILRQVDFPLQWIIGEDDKVIPKSKGIQQSSIAGVSFVSVYQQCGHMGMLEVPDMLAKDLEKFAVYCSKRKAKELLR